MASITIRNLDDEVKTHLRVRAAGNGRSPGRPVAPADCRVAAIAAWRWRRATLAISRAWASRSWIPGQGHEQYDRSLEL